jgi:hypothetical protein
MFENRALRIIFGTKREEETEGRRKIQNVKLYNLQSLPQVIKLMK